MYIYIYIYKYIYIWSGLGKLEYVKIHTEVWHK